MLSDRIKDGPDRYGIREEAEAAEEILLSLFFPRRCPVCHGIVRRPGRLVCPECRKKIAFVKEPTCRKCGKELREEEREYCEDCCRRARSFDGGVALMNYDRVGRSSMKGFKFQGRREYGAFYAEEIVKRYGWLIRGFRADAIVPVPMYWRKKCRRGYNQAEVLARELSKRCGVPVRAKMLLRNRETRAQKELNAEQRQRNLEHSFEAREVPEGVRRVILVDDIYTTGSTAEACTRALKRAGVQMVLLVTVCIGKND